VVTNPSTEAVRWFGRRAVEWVLGVIIAVIVILMVWKPGD
jgi:hypothetical protein